MTRPEDFLLATPLQARAKLTFQRIVDAAKDLLVEGGLAGLSTDAVAQRAEVNIATLYKYFANREALVRYLAVSFSQAQTDSLRAAIASFPPDAPIHLVLPQLIDTMVRDWTREPSSRAIQSIFLMDPVLYAEYSRASVDVAEALRQFRDPWGFEGTEEDWQRMHAVFGDCAIALLDRAAKSDPDEQERTVNELKALALAYFAVRTR